VISSSVQPYNSINILYVGQINASWWWLNLIQTCQGHFTRLVFYRNRYKKKIVSWFLEYKTDYFLWKWLNLTGYCKPGISWIEELHLCSQCMSNSVWFGLTEWQTSLWHLEVKCAFMHWVCRRGYSVQLKLVVSCVTIEAAKQRFSLHVVLTLISLYTYEVTCTIFSL
jgi:hypothetical protein